MKSDISEIRYTILFMKLNNQKNWQIRGKITKIVVTFHENKPNFKNIKIDVSPFKTSKYEIFTDWRILKTNPIQSQSNPILSQYQRWQTQTNPKQTQFQMYVVSRQSRSGIHNIPSIFEIFTVEYVRDKTYLFPPALPNIIMELHETFLED